MINTNNTNTNNMNNINDKEYLNDIEDVPYRETPTDYKSTSMNNLDEINDLSRQYYTDDFIAAEMSRNLGLDGNPYIDKAGNIYLTEDEAKQSIKQIKQANKNLESIKQTPFNQFIDTEKQINENNQELAYLKATQYNSSQNLFKNGTKDITIKGVKLNGDELITEDTDNIYIHKNDDTITIQKNKVKEYRIKDVLTTAEQEKFKESDPELRRMTNKEFADYINEVRTSNFSLSKAITKEMLGLREGLSDELVESIKKLDPMTLNEYSYLAGINQKNEPLIEEALLNMKLNKPLTPEQIKAIRERQYIDFSIQTRGITTGTEIITSLVENTKNNIWLGLAMKATGTALSIVAPPLGLATNLLSISIGFNTASKAYKYAIKPTMKALKLGIVSSASAYTDTLIKTAFIDKVVPRKYRTASVNERIQAERNRSRIAVTDKGGIYFKNLSQSMDDFIQHKVKTENFNEALSERAVDDILGGMFGFMSRVIPNSVKNNIVVSGISKVVKKVNEFPELLKLGTAHSFLTEHIEELFGISMNHIMKANDPDTTLVQSLSEYLEPRNLVMSSINILATGGILKAGANILNTTTSIANEATNNSLSRITETIGNTTDKITNNIKDNFQSLSDTIIKKHLKKKFDKNPNLEVNGINKDNYEEIIDNISESKKDELTRKVIEKEDYQSTQRYEVEKIRLKQNLLETGINETEVNHLLKTYEAIHTGLALTLGVSRYDITQDRKLYFKLTDKTGNNVFVNSNTSTNVIDNNATVIDVNDVNNTNDKDNTNNTNNTNNTINSILDVNDNNNSIQEVDPLAPREDELVSIIQSLDSDNIDNYLSKYYYSDDKQNNKSNFIIDTNNNIAIDYNTLSNTKTILNNYSKKSQSYLTPNDWFYIKDSINNNKFEDYYIDRYGKEIILDLDDMAVYLTGDNYTYISKVEKFPTYKTKERWLNRNKEIIEAFNKEQKKAKTIKDIKEEAKVQKNNDIFYIVDKNNNLMITKETMENIKDYISIEEIKEILKPKNLKSYFFDKKHKEILIDLSNYYENNGTEQIESKRFNLLVLTGKDYNLIDYKSFDNAMERISFLNPIENPHITKIKERAAKQTIKDIIAEAKDEMGEGGTTDETFNNNTNNIKTEVQKKEINIEELPIFKYISEITEQNKKLEAERLAKAKENMAKNQDQNLEDNTESYNQAINTELDLNQEIEILSIGNLIKKNGDVNEEGIIKLIQEIAESGEQIKTLSEPWVIDILNDPDKTQHLLNSSLNNKLNKKSNKDLKSRHNIALNNLRDLVNNSVLIERVENRKPTKKPDVAEYFYFYTPITDGKNIYIAKLNAEKLIGENELKNVHLYDVVNIKTDADVVSQVKESPAFATSQSAPITMSIADILSNVKDIDGNNTLESYLEELAENHINYKQDLYQDVKGSIDFTIKDKAFIKLFKDKFDQSTLIHETGHYFLKLLQDYAEKGNPTAQEIIKEIEEWTDSKQVEPQNKDLYIQEIFARSFEQYIRSGKYDNAYMKLTFDYFKDFLESIYKNAEDLGIDVNNQQMFEFFDKYIYNPGKYHSWVYNDNDEDDKKEEETNNEVNEIEEYYSGDIEVDEDGKPLSKEEISIKHENNIINLIFNQTDDSDENRSKTINQRIRELIDDITTRDMIKQNRKKNKNNNNNDNEIINNTIGYEDPESQTADLKLLINYTKESVKLFKEVLNNTRYEFNDLLYSNDIKMMKDMETNQIEENYILNKQERTKLEQELKQKLIKKYTKLKQQQYDLEKEAKYQDYANGYISIEEFSDYNEEDPLSEEKKSIDKTIIDTINKLFDKTSKQKIEFEQKLLARVNNNRNDFIETAKLNNNDREFINQIKEDFKPFRNINEAIIDYEKLNNDPNLKAKDRNNEYHLNHDEYTQLQNFVQKALLNKVNKLEQSITNNEQALKQAEKEKAAFKGFYDYAIEEITMLKYKADNEVKDIEKAMIKDKFFKSLDFNIYSSAEVKKSIQTLINKILRNTVRFSKHTGKIYGNIMYKDTGDVSILNRYNRMPMYLAKIEYDKLIKQRKDGTNKDSQDVYELKRDLLLFRSSPAKDLSPEQQNKILTALENFINKSKEELNKVRMEQYEQLRQEKKEVLDAILNPRRNEALTKSKISDLEKDNISHNGNLQTQLEYLAGKEIAKKYSDKLFGASRTYEDTYNQKQETIINKISDVLSKNKKTYDDMERTFKQWEEPLMELKIIKRDKDGYHTYKEVVLRQKLETLVDKLLVELESENNPFLTTEENAEDIQFLKNLKVLEKAGGGNYNHKYDLSEYEFQKLNEVIDKTKYAGKDNLINSLTKEYNTIAPYKINRWGLMYYSLLKRNKETNNLINKYYGTDQIEQLEKLLKKQSTEFNQVAEILFNAVQDRDELSARRVIEQNIDIGLIDNYFPRVSFHPTEINSFDMRTFDDTAREQTVSAVESRSKNAVPNLNNNPLFLTLRHVMQTSYSTTMSPALKEFTNIFIDPNIRQAIVDTKGQDSYNSLMKYVEALKMGIKNREDNIEQLMSHFLNNWTKSVVNTVSVFFKSITSTITFADDIENQKAFWKHYRKGIKNPKQTTEFMMNLSPMLKARFNKKNKQYQDILDIITNTKLEKNNPILAKFKKFSDETNDIFKKILPKKLTERNLMEWGDMASTISGAYARYQTLIESGKTEIEAIKDIEKHIAEIKPSNYDIMKSSTQLKNDFNNKTANKFKAQTFLYYQKTLRNKIRSLTGEESTKTLNKRGRLYHIYAPLALSAMQMLIDQLYGREFNPFKYAFQFFTSMISSYFPISLIKQSMIIDFAFSYRELKDILSTVFGALTGVALIPALRVLTTMCTWVIAGGKKIINMD